jgi:hypothetical protein
VFFFSLQPGEGKASNNHRPIVDSNRDSNRFKSAAAQIYEHPYNELVKGLCSGRLLHIDETSISIKEGNG